jgi:hypothetical protein
MGFKDWVDRNIVSLGPPKGPAAPAPAAKVSDAAVDEAGVKAVPGSELSFDKVFAAAQIAVPAHGFTIEKVGAMLGNAKLAALPREGRAAAVLVALEAAGVKIDSVIEEAVRKDKALDLFEKVQREHLEQVSQEKEEANRKLAAQIEANKAAVADLTGKVEAWAKKKAQAEAQTVGYFTGEDPAVLPDPGAGAKTKVTDLSKSLGK